MTMTDRKDFLLRLPAEDHEALRNLAHFTRRPMAEIARAALHDYLVGPGREELRQAVTAQGQHGMRDLLESSLSSPQADRLVYTTERTPERHG